MSGYILYKYAGLNGGRSLGTVSAAFVQPDLLYFPPSHHSSGHSNRAKVW